MIRRPRRSVPATVVAVVLLALVVLAATAAIQHLLGYDPIVSPQALAAPVVGRAWNDPVIIIAGVIATLFGLILLATALRPGTPTVLPLADDPGTGREHTDTGVSRRSLRRDLTSIAAAADGVSAARLKVGRRRITVTVRTPVADTGGIPEQVRGLLADRLDDINPARRPALRIKTSTERGS
ncbi:DUF6286 domain-containing protein [Saccharopolyspora sp. ASAGF58]|uniref:DUF6286 domain-containing protein n=1 Tax=Saccharopolyspora sp. ASAGF58 TaxID=2719023 RepID=UPI00143FE50F|nr:DUF6286 domain-containing protein [Saccharopolyspora sp. ASAGF58]QIZ38094.1 hypothetical protein FDZ84_30400 [Saccharopolyspora sp. ASAGF58]